MNCHEPHNIAGASPNAPFLRIAQLQGDVRMQKSRLVEGLRMNKLLKTLTIFLIVSTACSSEDNSMPDPGFEAAALVCLPAESSDPLPARSSILGGEVVATGQRMFTRDLFGLFRSNCGGCHVDAAFGDYQLDLDSFPTEVTQDTVDRIVNDDPDEYMPPPSAGGKPFSERAENDGVAQLAVLLQTWIDAGSPTDVFDLPEGVGGSDESPFVLTSETGLAMTNIGDCVPSNLGDPSVEERARELDAKFEAMTELPERLEETDLFTLDGEELARHGVIGYAPTYTLWSDNAKKIRRIRVPLGTSIEFDAETQNFDMPPNTRVYKTFLKRVIDLEGNESYRKIETRLIVARPDRLREDGTYETTALFGTYAWNEEETEAILVLDPLRDGSVSRDRLVTYVSDERRAEEILAANPFDVQEAFQSAGIIRSYPIPGSQRCVNCHMGSPLSNFILGFTPLQVNRRPQGIGGIIEPVGRHEADQLQRFIDYGLITGMESPEDVVPLEESQGERKPRNEYELKAQGYMIGNCAHCHNPRGLPSVTVEGLAELLNFLPNRDDGGIFQFPLERYSPRIRRGERQDIPIPYITPSLYDLPVTNGRALLNDIWKPKSDTVADIDGFETELPNFAPWRSLIYRNVDTPFTYSDHYAIYPKMPQDVPGFDCRAPRVLGEWMVSIPAVIKNQTFRVNQAVYGEPQPFRELTPDDDEVTVRVAGNDALRRLERFRDSPRYNTCPDQADTVDPDVVAGNRLTPRTDPYNVPERPHWVVTDLTENPGDWIPRRADWEEILVEQQVEGLGDAEKRVVEKLQTIELTREFEEFALTQVPFGFWEQKPECNFEGIPRVSDLNEGEEPLWLPPSAPEDAPLYMQAPGAAVFNLICANCHGTQGDSNGRQADTIATLTGGETRVANFRTGLFGFSEDSRTNRDRVFGTGPWSERYLVWMALGGTDRQIPESVLRVVSNTQVLGQSRPSAFNSRVPDANMLTTARQLCEQVVPIRTAQFDLNEGRIQHDGGPGTALIKSNGDSELWETLCAFDNPGPIRALRLGNPWTNTSKFTVDLSTVNYGLYDRIDIGDAPIGRLGGVDAGLQDSNPAPWCIVKPTDPAQIEVAEAFVAANPIGGQPLPFCPEVLFERDGTGNEIHRFESEEIDDWTLRGAMNAGLAVYVYLDAISKGAQPPPAFNACERLNP